MRLADADLVTAIIKKTDHLKERAQAALAAGPTPVVPFSVGIELLFVARKFGSACIDFLGAAEADFKLEERELLFSAAEALDTGDVTTVFDAVHAATALHAGAPLLTTDRRLLDGPFPTATF